MYEQKSKDGSFTMTHLPPLAYRCQTTLAEELGLMPLESSLNEDYNGHTISNNLSRNMGIKKKTLIKTEKFVILRTSSYPLASVTIKGD